MDLGLKNKTAFITGGSSGIGYAIAESFVEEGANVIIASRDYSNVESAVKRLKRKNPTVKVIGKVKRPVLIESQTERITRPGGMDAQFSGARRCAIRRGVVLIERLITNSATAIRVGGIFHIRHLIQVFDHANRSAEGGITKHDPISAEPEPLAVEIIGRAGCQLPLPTIYCPNTDTDIERIASNQNLVGIMVSGGNISDNTDTGFARFAPDAISIIVGQFE